MIEINFYLDKKKNRTKFLIFAYASFDGQRPKKSTKILIEEANWNPEKQRAIARKTKLAIPINNLLSKIKSQAEVAYYSSKLTEEEFNFGKIVLSIVGSKKEKEKMKKAKPTLITFIADLIAERNKINKDDVNTKPLQTAFNHIKHFNDFHYPIDFDNIDLKFFKEFKNYLLIEKDYKNSFAAKVVSKLKYFMNEALEAELHTNIKHKSKKFSIAADDADNIYYNVPDLIKLYNYKFTEEHLERSRDAFLIDAFTCFRFSDGIQLKKDRIFVEKGMKYIEHITKKTKTRIIIPLHWIVEEIIEKYQDDIPKVTNQQLNINLKAIFKEAGFNKIIQLNEHRGGKRKVIEYEQWQVTTTHTGRRSFATNSIAAGMTEMEVMELGGWKSISNFRKYLKHKKIETARRVAGNHFWQKPELRKVK